ncbi:MAG TPA: Ig-like domain-containing protein [Terriglobia bacterium]|nr:Ig-like domain-containing protein [Terriglobia bacterium]
MRWITSCGVRAFAVILLFSIGMVAKQQTATTLTSSPNPSTSGESVTFTATVTSQQSGQSNQHCPDGVVQFEINGTNYGAPVQVVPPSPCGGDGGSAYASASITTSFPNGGSYPVVAIYGGDTDFADSTSQTYTQVVGTPSPIQTTAALVSSSPNGSVDGESVTFTATVTPAHYTSGPPTGTVTFTLGTAPNTSTLFIGSLNSLGYVDFNTFTLPQGGDTITATYSGDNHYTGSTATLVQNVTAPAKITTSIALASAPNPSIAGEQVWLTATVTPSDWTFGNPTGTITFTSGNVTLTGTLSSGWVTVATSSLPPGADTITATYSGDNNYGGSSGTLTQQVNSPTAISTSIALVASPNPSIAGQPVWLTATVTPSDWNSGDPTGTVTITLTTTGGQESTLFNAALPPAGFLTFTTTSLPQGADTITATYSGDSNYGGSASAPVTQQVNPPPPEITTSTALVASPNPSVFGQPVWLTATVTPADWSFGDPTGTVTFTSGNVTLTGTLSSGPTGDWVTVQTSALPPGSDPITATYNGDSNHSGSTSATVTQQVNQPPGKITTSVALAASPNPSVAGQPAWFTATVTPADWSFGDPTGTVTITSGGVTQTVTLSGGPTGDWVTVQISSLPQGNDTITATYSGDSHYSGNTTTMVQTVTPIGTTLTLVASPNPSVFGQPVVITAIVTPDVWGSGTPSGTVTISSGGVTLTGTLTDGWVDFATSALAQGADTITGAYSGDSTFKVSSGTLPLTVNPASLP